MLRWIRRLILFLLATVVIAYGTVKFVVPAAISTQFVSSRIESSLSAALARPVKLTPDLQISWGLHPHLKLSEVTIGNPSGINDSRPFISLKQVEAKLNTWTLFTDEISFPLVAFQTAEVTLLKKQSGESNWSFGSGDPEKRAAETKPAGAPWLPRIKRIQLDSLKLAYEDAQSGERRNVQLEGFAIDDFGGGGTISIRSHAALDDRTFTLRGKALELGRFLNTGRLPLQLQIEHDGQKLELDGVITRGEKSPIDIDTKVKLAGTNFAKLLKSYGLKTFPDVSNNDIEGKIAYRDKTLAVSVNKATLDDVALNGEAHFTFGQPRLLWKMQAQVKGSHFQNLLKGFGVIAPPPVEQFGAQLSLDSSAAGIKIVIADSHFDGTTLTGEIELPTHPTDRPWTVRAEIEGSRFDDLLRGFGVGSPPPIDRFRANISVDSSATGLKIALADSDLDGTTLTGAIELPAHPTDRVVTGKAALMNCDLTRLFPSTGSHATETREEPRDQHLFSDEKIDLAALRNLRINVDLALTNVTPVAGLDLPSLSANVSVADGELTVSGLDAKVFGGSVKGDLTLRENGLQAKVHAKKLAYDKVSPSRGITGGTMDLDLDLKGSGSSPRAIASSLNGSIDFRLNDVPLAGGGLFLTTSNLFEILNPLSKDSKTVLVECGLAQFKVTNGIADAGGLALKIGDVSILGDGAIDLKKEELSLGFVPRSTSVGAATLIPPIKVFGPLSSPTILPNPLKLATSQIDNIEGILSGAIGTIGDLADFSDDDTEEVRSKMADTCEEIIEDNADKLTTLVGGLVFGDRPDLIKQVREKKLLESGSEESGEAKPAGPVRKTIKALRR